METEGAVGASTSFTSIEMVHTHTPQQRGFFGRRSKVAEIWQLCRNSMLLRDYVVDFTGDLLHVPKIEVTGRWYTVEPSGFVMMPRFTHRLANAAASTRSE